MLSNILANLGVDPEESRLYALLLETGPLPAGKLAGRTGIARSSLYGILIRMQDKGLVAQSIRNGIKVFSAQDPAKINLLFQEKIEQLKSHQISYKKLLPNLLAQATSKLLTPKFQLYEGQEGLKNILQDMLLYNDLQTSALWPIKSMVATLSPQFFKYFNEERIRNRLHTRAIWPVKQCVDIEQHPYLGSGPEFYRQIRIAPKDMDFSMGYWIYADKVAFISSKRESFGFTIQSPELVELLMTQFDVVWQISKPIESQS
jgi:sugar-specific transcriptional regulator TrmB